MCTCKHAQLYRSASAAGWQPATRSTPLSTVADNLTIIIAVISGREYTVYQPKQRIMAYNSPAARNRYRQYKSCPRSLAIISSHYLYTISTTSDALGRRLFHLISSCPTEGSIQDSELIRCISDWPSSSHASIMYAFFYRHCKEATEKEQRFFHRASSSDWRKDDINEWFSLAGISAIAMSWRT